MDKAVFSLIGYKFNHVSLNLDNIPSNASFDLEFTPKGEYVQSEGLYKAHPIIIGGMHKS